MKKSVVCAFALTLVFAAACQKQKSGADAVAGGSAVEKPVLTVGIFAQEHEQKMYQEVINRFQEQNQVTVKFNVAGDQYWPQLEAALTANTAPDVFYLGVGDIKRRVWAGKVSPINELLNIADLEKIWPDALNLYRYDEASDTLGGGGDIRHT
ncbi:MAG: extracellular solute-binding protein [Treponema sp.]|nr:extracellular solute-binding protein [Treponema sp.]